MKKIIVLFLLIIIYQFSIAADTTWLNNKWKTTAKENSTYYIINKKEPPLWQQQMFYSNSGRLYMNGYFMDSSCMVKTGNFKWYNKNGILTDSVVYQKNIPLYMCIFHDNGQKKTVLTRDQNGNATYVNSWDKLGNESYLDTFYHDSRGHDCNIDTAFLRGIINKEDSIWRLRFYYTSNDSLYITEYYKERLCKTRVKYGSWYRRGLLRDSILFNDNGKKTAAWYFHNNGNKNAYQVFDTTGKIISAKNWDEKGRESYMDTSLMYAVPPGGNNNWSGNIIKRTNNNNTLDWKYRENIYASITLRFFIEEDGNLKMVLVKQSSSYPEMDSLILKSCKEDKLWKPSTLHGRRQTFILAKSFSIVAGKLTEYQRL